MATLSKIKTICAHNIIINLINLQIKNKILPLGVILLSYVNLDTPHVLIQRKKMNEFEKVQSDQTTPSAINCFVNYYLFQPKKQGLSVSTWLEV